MRLTILSTKNATGKCRLKLTNVHRASRHLAYRRYDMKKPNVHCIFSKKVYLSGEDRVAQEDNRPKEEGGGVRLEGFSIDEIREIIDLGGRMCLVTCVTCV